jgi:hypothetical protein
MAAQEHARELTRVPRLRRSSFVLLFSRRIARSAGGIRGSAVFDVVHGAVGAAYDVVDVRSRGGDVGADTRWGVHVMAVDVMRLGQGIVDLGCQAGQVGG